jgi:PAS domain S-box-containing protein
MLDRFFADVRRSAQRLQDSEAALQSMGDNLPGGYVFQYTHDADGKPRFTYVSAGVERVHGVKVAEVMRDPGYLLPQIDPSLKPAYRAAAANSAGELADFEMELPVRRSTGEERLIYVRSRPRRTGTGQVQWDGLAVDITDRKQAEKRLREREEQLRLFVEHSPAAIAMLDAEMRYLVVSRRWLADYRLKEQDVTGRSHYEVFPEIPESWRAIHRRCLAGAVERSDADPFPRADGSLDWVRWEIRPWHTGAGEVGGLMVFSEVITERMRAEAALRENQQLLKVVLDLVPHFIFAKDGHGRHLFVNRACAAAHGLTPEQLVGRTDQDFVRDREQAEAFMRADREVIEGGKPKFIAEERLTLPTGETRILQTIKTPFLAPGGVPALVGVALDVTDLKAAEAARRRSEARLTFALEASHTGAWYLNLEDHTATRTPIHARIFGAETAAPGWNFEAFLAQILPEDRARVSAQIREAMAARTDWNFECRILRPDGEVRWIFVAGGHERNPENAPGRVSGIVQDITERKQVEAEAARERLLLRTLIDLLPDNIFVKDTAGKFLLGNVALAKALGKNSPQEIVGRSDADFFRPALAEVFQADEARVLAGESLLDHEEEADFRDGARRVSLTTKVPFCDAQGRVCGLVGIGRDITERKAAEAALRQSEEQFRAMFELASIGMAQADPTTRRWVRVNRKMCEITGYSAAELLQLHVPELTHPEDRDRDEDLFRRVIRGEAPDYRLEKRYLCKDGAIAWVNVNMAAIRDAAGRPVRSMATIEDITERKQAEETVRLQSAALAAAANAIVITDQRGRIEWVNRAFSDLTGYAAADALGKNPRLLKSGQQEPAFYTTLWNTILAGDIWHGELVNRRKDGGLYHEDMTITPLRDAGGAVTHFIAIKQDITERKRLEVQFRQSQKMEAIGTLAGGVAHDFNNILTSILMQVELGGEEAGLPTDLRESFRQIRSDAERAAALTRQLLLFSRRQVMQSRDLDLNEVVTNLTKMLQRIIGEDVRLQLHLHSTPLLVHADAGMLDQVLMNLVVNARDAMPEGGRLIVATGGKLVDETLALSQPDATPGRYACLSVSDTGRGIPAEVLPRIFEPFFTTKEAGKGTGLGLATVFGIVKQHGGWIKVANESGQGATFQVFLPITNPVAATAAATARRKPLGGTETILLAEDEEPVRKSIRIVLVRNGYTVLEAATGAEALRVWAGRRGTVALLLTDLVMPGGISGQQLARQLRADKPDLKIVYTSGYSAGIAGREIQLQAGEQFMQKPVLPDDLLKTVRQCLDA